MANPVKLEDEKEELKRQLELYLKWERNPKYKEEIENLANSNRWEQLQKLLGKRLTFGTAGIRGKMGPGFGQMNDLVIIQTSQGLASYLLEIDQAAARSRGIIIGFDARHNSHRFARHAALAFLQKNIPVYLIDYICPTPLVAFGVIKYNCCAGIVVTASHNPKQDNGYKVYWSNGAQILSPHDEQIQRHIMMADNQQPWALAWSESLLTPPTPQNAGNLSFQQDQLELLRCWRDGKLLFRCYKELTSSYYEYIESMMRKDRKKANQEQQAICITYTTMHGVGHTFLTRALETAGFDDIFPVQLQKDPDPEFSTVKFPNPEEAGALDLAFETAAHANSNLILANDPDADRCAAALYEPKSGRRRILNGNEIGSLLGWWIWHSYSKLDEFYTPIGEQDSNTCSGFKHLARDCYMISTAVSSKFLYSMAMVEGFKFVETLTGFKYMGNVADTLIRDRQKRVLFAYEEAIGYMCDPRILDKDGISAAVQLATCAAYVAKEYNRTLEQQLNWLYTRYGFHYNLNSYFLCHDPNIIKEIFTKLQHDYPRQFSNEFKVTRIRDLNKNYDTSTENKECTLPTSTSSYMVTFFINDNITLTIRTSGTEPKIKYYSEIVQILPPLSSESAEQIENEIQSEKQLAAKEEARDKLRRVVRLAIEQCLKPANYNLEPAE